MDHVILVVLLAYLTSLSWAVSVKRVKKGRKGSKRVTLAIMVLSGFWPDLTRSGHHKRWYTAISIWVIWRPVQNPLKRGSKRVKKGLFWVFLTVSGLFWVRSEICWLGLGLYCVFGSSWPALLPDWPKGSKKGQKGSILGTGSMANLEVLIWYIYNTAYGWLLWFEDLSETS